MKRGSWNLLDSEGLATSLDVLIVQCTRLRCLNRCLIHLPPNGCKKPTSYLKL